MLNGGDKWHFTFYNIFIAVKLFIYLFIFIAVKFLTKPQNTTVVIGKSAFLHCNATASPEPVVSWRKEEGERDEKRFKQLKNGTLLIRDARMSDAGQYLCIAANQLDLKETKVTLRVVGTAGQN